MWGHLEPSRAIWDLGPSGAIWGDLKPSEAIWGNLEPSEAIWGYLGPSEVIWERGNHNLSVGIAGRSSSFCMPA